MGLRGWLRSRGELSHEHTDRQDRDSKARVRGDRDVQSQCRRHGQSDRNPEPSPERDAQIVIQTISTPGGSIPTSSNPWINYGIPLGIVAAIVVVALAVFLRRRKERKKDQAEDRMAGGPPPGPPPPPPPP